MPYALTNVVEDEGDFIVSEGHGHPLVTHYIFCVWQTTRNVFLVNFVM
jgi:hypothetical protein